MDDASIETWHDRLVRRYTGGVETAPHPEAVLIVGPRSAGKSVLLEIVCRWFANRGQCVAVNPHEILLQHPRYAESAAIDPAAAEEACRADAAAATDQLIAAALSQGCHLSVELRPDDPEWGANLVQQVIAHGHHLQVIVLAVDPQVSRESFEQRALQLSEDLELEIVPDLAVHDRSATEVSQWLDWLTANEPAVPLYVVTRDGRVLASTDSAINPPTRRITDCLNDSTGDADEVKPEEIGDRPGTPANEPPTPSVVQVGERRIKLGAFEARPTAKAPEPESAVQDQLAASADSQSDAAAGVPKQRGMKLGKFRPNADVSRVNHEPSAESSASRPAIEQRPAIPVHRPPSVTPSRPMPVAASPPPEIEEPPPPVAADDQAAPPDAEIVLRNAPDIQLDALPPSKQRAVEHRIGLQRRIRIRAGLETPDQ